MLDFKTFISEMNAQVITHNAKFISAVRTQGFERKHHKHGEFEGPKHPVSDTYHKKNHTVAVGIEPEHGRMYASHSTDGGKSWKRHAPMSLHKKLIGAGMLKDE